jgi:class 3 adenylate cyclase
MQRNGQEREVVILMADMVQYSQISSGMTPSEIRDFLVNYHDRIHEIIDSEENYPLDSEPSAGDGSLMIFDKREGEDRAGVCTRALHAALQMAEAIQEGSLAPTRMGILLGEITEAQIGSKMAKFGASFAVANRLEELCGYFGTTLLMDREVARYQQGFEKDIVNIAKVSLTSVLHPMNIFTIYKPGIHCALDIDPEKLHKFISMKNSAMEFFTGNLLLAIRPNFPLVRDDLLKAQSYFIEITGRKDIGIERILEYIRETPFPASDFDCCGMKLMEKKRDSLGERLFHLSKELLKAMDPDFYYALVVDTGWEQFFKLEWKKAGEVIVEINSVPDGIYYIDSGTAETFNVRNELLSTMDAGMIFGEMAYFGKEKKRTATVRAKTDIVLRKISTRDFENLPIIIKIFERIAIARRQEIVEDSMHPTDTAASLCS